MIKQSNMFKETYDVFDRVRNTIESSSKKIKGNILGYFSTLSAKKIAGIEESQGIQFAPVVKKMYSKACNGIHMDWKINSNENNRMIEGKTEIFSLERLYSTHSYYYEGRKEIKDYIWLANSKHSSARGKYYVLDHCEYGNYALFILENNEPILYWYNAYDELKKLKLTLDEYLNHAIMFGGILLWQEYFVEDFENSPIKDISDNIAIEIQKVNTAISENYFTEKIKPNKNSQFHRYLNSHTKIDYFKMINEACIALKKNKKFKKVKYKINPGVSIASLRRYQGSQNQELPTELIEFYYSVNGFSVKWETENEGKVYHGQINIQSLEELMGGHKIKEWNQEIYRNQYWFDDNDAPLLKSLKRFENIVGESSDIVIHITDKSYDLYYLEQGKPISLDMNIKTYVKNVLNVMGIDGWFLHHIPKTHSEGLNVIKKEEIKEIFHHI